ncbi:hypothetical protein FW778_00105 [Ginsengibacter hankyongi]|uniref:Outer membrane protein beta-barrel domain-containing protein n=1 Tax=Ginsengibacter hankyongi TaxID=2607284 RepID=A0A5J5II95_9BACT|nr:hypothetical protein [Ginsengibacter hankyongi]KAA9040491.1 hypothetical protein FW778_00105 [Ginsengibacter hankyongi]
MKKTTLFFAIIFMAAASVSAQTYSTAVGAKFYAGDGTYGGLNIRHSTSEHTALEGSLLFASGSIGLEGLYQYQAPIAGAEGLQYFVGGGGLLAFGTGRGDNSTAFALRLTGGVDYKFADAPIDVSLGFDPFFYLTPSTSSNLALGIGLRYVIK